MSPRNNSSLTLNKNFLFTYYIANIIYITNMMSLPGTLSAGKVNRKIQNIKKNAMASMNNVAAKASRSVRLSSTKKFANAGSSSIVPLTAGLANMTLTKTERNRARRKRNRNNLRNELNYVDPLSIGPVTTRGGDPNNPADPRSSRSLRALGRTPAGREWVLRLLHPNGEGLNVVPKIPDGAVNNSIALSRSDEYILSIPTDLAVEDWTCGLLHTPFLLRTRIAYAFDPSNAPSSETLVYNLQTFLEKVDPFKDGPGVYPAWYTIKDGTMTLCFTFLNPNSLSYQSTFDNVREVRRVCYGCTVDFDFNELYNHGRVTSGQFPPDVALRQAYRVIRIADPDAEVVTEVDDIYFISAPPLLQDGITQTDVTLKYQNEAVCGSYLPLRLWAPDVAFTPVSEMRKVALNHFKDVVDNPDATLSGDLILRGFGWGVDVYAGIHKTAKLRLKVNEILEVLPTNNSVYSPFLTPGASRDARAFEIATEFGRISPHCYVADYNHSNGLFGSIISNLGNAVSNLGIPIVSDLASIAGGILGMW